MKQTDNQASGIGVTALRKRLNVVGELSALRNSSFTPLKAAIIVATTPVTLVITIDTTGETDSPASQPMPKPVTTRAVMTPARVCLESELPMRLLFSLLCLLRLLGLCTSLVQEDGCQLAAIGE